MDHEGPAEDTADLDTALGSLRESGAAFLVCGDVPSCVHEQACERWLGRGGRTRLVVRTLGTRAPDLTTAETIGLETSMRSAAQPSPSAETSVGSLSELGTTLVDTLSRLEARTGDPGELRVCVEAVDPLRRHADDETVFRFLHLLAHRVRAADALAHVHLAAGPDDELTGTLQSLFDGVVTLRADGSVAEEQWHLTEQNLTTEWLPVETGRGP